MNLPVVILADRTDDDGVDLAFRELYYVSMLERHIRNFAFLGTEKITVITGPGEARTRMNAFIEALDRTWFESTYPVDVVGPDDVGAYPSNQEDGSYLVIDAHHLYDQRALDAVVTSDPDVLLVDVDATTTHHASEPCHLAILSLESMKAHLTDWQGSAIFWNQLTTQRRNAQCRTLNIRDIDPYIINLRRSIAPYWLPVLAASDVETGEGYLIDAAQKGTLDFPARYLHPPFENWMTRYVARFPWMSPNFITTATNVVAFITTALLAIGDIGLGLFLAAVVGVLDGVDGKLARTTVRCTVFGDRYEHILDNVYELSWYWALGWAFSNGGVDTYPLVLSGLMTIFYILDRGFTGGFKYFKSIELFDYAPIDRFFRQIGSRRNINILMMIVGTAAFVPYYTYETVVGWMAFTALFHGVRAAWIGLLSSRSDRIVESVGDARP
ncbi:MAG: hypothetical protein HOH43_08780 [Candidatus Latescibacteria bacterium]|jgi:phosphatidylglycerophosphate synthase|nr:hypothetical protein [Candidatus Latescibacterota bacterium]